MVEQAARVVGAVLVGAYVARYLGPERYGLLSYAFSFLAVFAAISSLGIESIAVLSLVRAPGDESKILGTAFGLRIVGTLLMWSLIAVGLLVSAANSESTVLIAIVSLGAGFQVFRVIEFYFQSRVESSYVVRVQLVVLAVSSAVKILLVQLDAQLVWFAVVTVIDGFTLALGLIAVYRSRSGRSLAWKFEWKLARGMWIDSWPVLVYAYFVAANMNLDRLMLRALSDDRSVGLYSAAVSISSAWYLVPVALGSTFYPYIINRGQTPGDRTVASLFSLLFFVSVAGASVLAGLSDRIVSLVFGSEFAAAAPVLAIHAFTGIFVFHVSLRSRVLTAANNQRLSTWLMGGCLGSNVVGNLVLIPRYGVEGAAWASVVSWALCVLFFPLFLRDTRRFVKLFVSPRFRGIGKIAQ